MKKTAKENSARSAFKRLKYMVAIDADERFEEPVKDAAKEKNPELFLDYIKENPFGAYRDLMHLSSSKKRHQEKAAILLSVKSVLSTLHDAGVGLPELRKLMNKQSAETLQNITIDPESEEILERLGYDGYTIAGLEVAKMHKPQNTDPANEIA